MCATQLAADLIDTGLTMKDLKTGLKKIYTAKS